MVTYPSQNYDLGFFNNNVSGNIQVDLTNKEGTSNDLDGYLAEFHFVDGQQLTPSSFGFTEQQTGQWMLGKVRRNIWHKWILFRFPDNSSTAALGI